MFLDHVLGVINLINEQPFLKELTAHRCLASVPFGGRNRLIDFTLSNFIHAHVTQVAIFAKENYRSVMDHVGSGKEWDLDRHNGGLFILPPIHADEKIKGDLQQFYDHLEFFRRAPADFVIISPGHHVCKLDFNDVIQFHKNNKADITVVYKSYDGEPIQKPIYHNCLLDEADNITDIGLYTSPAAGDAICLETYVLSKQLLIDIIQKCKENGEVDFLKDGVKANLHHLNIKGYHFTGYMPFIHSISSFYAGNLAFLKPEVLHAFFYENWDIYTKIKHEPPVKYSAFSQVSNALLANGCDIEGSVENSILFRGVKVKKGAVVKNSIIMQKGEVEEGAHVENVIADKQVRITKDKVIIGDRQPAVMKKGEII